MARVSTWNYFFIAPSNRLKLTDYVSPCENFGFMTSFDAG